MMSVNVPAALRPVFAHPQVLQYLRTHDPAALKRAQQILAKPDKDISPLETVHLAECAARGADITNLTDLFAHARSQLADRSDHRTATE
jgi:hypothetical protein